jgi:hypothetical protein
VLTIMLSRELVGSGRVLFPGTGQLNNQGTNVSAAGLALRPGQVPLKLSQVHNLRGSVPTHSHIFGGPLRQWVFFGGKYSEQEPAYRVHDLGHGTIKAIGTGWSILS